VQFCYFWTLIINLWDNRISNNWYAKTNWYHMLENRCFETRVKLFFANFWNPAWVLKIWKQKFWKKNRVESFKTVSYLDSTVIVKKN
jgi:hypothetical protein